MALLSVSDSVLQRYNQTTGREPLVRSFLDKIDKTGQDGFQVLMILLML